MIVLWSSFTYRHPCRASLRFFLESWGKRELGFDGSKAIERERNFNYLVGRG